MLSDIPFIYTEWGTICPTIDSKGTLYFISEYQSVFLMLRPNQVGGISSNANGLIAFYTKIGNEWRAEIDGVVGPCNNRFSYTLEIFIKFFSQPDLIEWCYSEYLSDELKALGSNHDNALQRMGMVVSLYRQ